MASLCMATMAAIADTLDGKVVGVSDGDTVTLLVDSHRQVKVRIAGIDAPEKSQAFGQAAKKAMSECSFGKAASVEWKKLDLYGRTIGKLFVDGVDCGMRQIELGVAWHYKTYEREQDPADRLAYAEAEDKAKSDRRGLWSDATPVPPWDYRHSRVKR
jgi:endonuclease YncB( thermonuclease family)